MTYDEWVGLWLNGAALRWSAVDDTAWGVRIATNPASAPVEYWVALFGPEAGPRLYSEARLAAMMAAAGPR